jgi:hypothetical protein
MRRKYESPEPMYEMARVIAGSMAKRLRYRTSNRPASLEANQAAHEQRLAKTEKDADQYRQDSGEIRDRISRIKGY